MEGKQTDTKIFYHELLTTVNNNFVIVVTIYHSHSHFFLFFLLRKFIFLLPRKMKESSTSCRFMTSAIQQLLLQFASMCLYCQLMHMTQKWSGTEHDSQQGVSEGWARGEQGASKGYLLSRSQLKAKFIDFVDENRLIFVDFSCCFQRLEKDFGFLFWPQQYIIPLTQGCELW